MDKQDHSKTPSAEESSSHTLLLFSFKPLHRQKSPSKFSQAGFIAQEMTLGKILGRRAESAIHLLQRWRCPAASKILMKPSSPFPRGTYPLHTLSKDGPWPPRALCKRDATKENNGGVGKIRQDFRHSTVMRLCAFIVVDVCVQAQRGLLWRGRGIFWHATLPPSPLPFPPMFNPSN